MATEADETIRVVVVDDHAVVRRGLFAFFEGEADIDVVGDAQDAHEALKQLARLDAAALTSRELDVLRLLGGGHPNKTIASELGITERTARTHVSKILAKLGLSSRTQAALWAVREGIADAQR